MTRIARTLSPDFWYRVAVTQSGEQRIERMFTEVYDRAGLVKVAIYAGTVTLAEHKRAIAMAWEMTS